MKKLAVGDSVQRRFLSNEQRSSSASVRVRSWNGLSVRSVWVRFDRDTASGRLMTGRVRLEIATIHLHGHCADAVLSCAVWFRHISHDDRQTCCIDVRRNPPTFQLMYYASPRSSVAAGSINLTSAFPVSQPQGTSDAEKLAVVDNRLFRGVMKKISLLDFFRRNWVNCIIWQHEYYYLLAFAASVAWMLNFDEISSFRKISWNSGFSRI